jgi:hypothetical protein
MSIDEARDRRDREAKAHAEAISRWLKIAGLAVPAVMSAAAAGNVTCREAMVEILPLLPVGAVVSHEGTKGTEGEAL